eukprot:2425595-Rhodomonas_salina.1
MLAAAVPAVKLSRSALGWLKRQSTTTYGDREGADSSSEEVLTNGTERLDGWVERFGGVEYARGSTKGTVRDSTHHELQEWESAMAGMNFRYLCLILVVFALLPWVSGENAEAAGAHQVGDVNAPFEFIETSAPSPFSSSAISTPRPLTSAPTTIVPVVCGNGNREEQESCDDSNVADGDGCSQNCTVETGCTCSAPSTGPDTCALQSTPPTGQNLWTPSASRSGPAWPRRCSQVIIETASRRRAEGAVLVEYRVVVEAAAGRTVASRVAASHAEASFPRAPPPAPRPQRLPQLGLSAPSSHRQKARLSAAVAAAACRRRREGQQSPAHRRPHPLSTEPCRIRSRTITVSEKEEEENLDVVVSKGPRNSGWAEEHLTCGAAEDRVLEEEDEKQRQQQREEEERTRGPRELKPLPVRVQPSEAKEEEEAEKGEEEGMEGVQREAGR